MSERVVMQVRLGQIWDRCREWYRGTPVCEQACSGLRTSSALERIKRTNRMRGVVRSGMLSRARALGEPERAAPRLATPTLSEGSDSPRTRRLAAQQCRGVTNRPCSQRAVGTASCSLQVGSKP
jgi:hypothetical protein